MEGDKITSGPENGRELIQADAGEQYSRQGGNLTPEGHHVFITGMSPPSSRLCHAMLSALVAIPDGGGPIKAASPLLIGHRSGRFPPWLDRILNSNRSKPSNGARRCYIRKSMCQLGQIRKVRQLSPPRIQHIELGISCHDLKIERYTVAKC